MRGIWACLIFGHTKNSKLYLFHIPLSYINYYPWSSIILPYHQLHHFFCTTIYTMSPMFYYYPYEPWQNQQRWFIPNRARRASTRTNPIYASSSPNCWEWQQCHAYQHAWGIQGFQGLRELQGEAKIKTLSFNMLHCSCHVIFRFWAFLFLGKFLILLHWMTSMTNFNRHCGAFETQRFNRGLIPVDRHGSIGASTPESI